MQPYQNYYTPVMQTIPQQNFNQPMQIQNPYMDRMNQLQQYQQNLNMVPSQMSGASQQTQGIVGKIVNDFSELTANDVPMNGSAAFFPKADGSELQVRSWTANGTIQTVVYKPVQHENSAEGTNIPQMDFNALNEDVRALREDIKGVREMIEKSMTVPPAKTTARGKKAEVNADE